MVDAAVVVYARLWRAGDAPGAVSQLESLEVGSFPEFLTLS